jgi:hypothetical protein
MEMLEPFLQTEMHLQVQLYLSDSLITRAITTRQSQSQLTEFTINFLECQIEATSGSSSISRNENQNHVIRH